MHSLVGHSYVHTFTGLSNKLTPQNVSMGDLEGGRRLRGRGRGRVREREEGGEKGGGRERGRVRERKEVEMGERGRR